MDNLTREQADAIADMGRGRPDYNEGVLAMLGKGELARTYSARRREVDALVEERDALPQGANFDAQLNPAPEIQAIQARINEASDRLNQAWAPIAEMIASARVIVDRIEGERQA